MSKDFKKEFEDLEKILKKLETGDASLDDAVDAMKKSKFTI
ncbi:MAG: exodeoxyribonuclease VII small subunit [Candidatus Peribacteria bacterium]|jgi:exonuclease VII small subunit|nr:exodeoxyribonuclease VII small subunit [Candidatus Peribacteria bacterium]